MESDDFEPIKHIAAVRGKARHLLLGKRIALNLLAGCSWIATVWVVFGPPSFVNLESAKRVSGLSARRIWQRVTASMGSSHVSGRRLPVFYIELGVAEQCRPFS